MHTGKYHLLAALQEPYKKAHLLTDNAGEFCGKVQSMGH